MAIDPRLRRSRSFDEGSDEALLNARTSAKTVMIRAFAFSVPLFPDVVVDARAHSGGADRRVRAMLDAMLGTKPAPIRTRVFANDDNATADDSDDEQREALAPAGITTPRRDGDVRATHERVGVDA